MPKIKFSERIKKLAEEIPVIGPIISADKPEEIEPKKPIVLIKPYPDIDPPKPVKPREEDK